MHVQRFVTAAFYFLLISAALFLATLPVCPWTQRQVMEKFHLRSPSFIRFGLLQLLPSMYNLDNEAAVSAARIPGDPFASTGTMRFQTNHYPLRVVSFGLNNRSEFQKGGFPRYVYLRSRYQAQQLNSLYVVKPQSNGLNVKLEQ
jgi:hypothetical protein